MILEEIYIIVILKYCRFFISSITQDRLLALSFVLQKSAQSRVKPPSSHLLILDSPKANCVLIIARSPVKNPSLTMSANFFGIRTPTLGNSKPPT